MFFGSPNSQLVEVCAIIEMQFSTYINLLRAYNRYPRDRQVCVSVHSGLARA